MNGYTKLFSSIVTSTIWREDLATKVVWVTLLALSDSSGVVEGSVPGLAHIAGVTLEECEMSLSKLSQPDKYSRTPDHEGCRIEAIDGGWFILNRAKYRDLIPDERRRERDRLRQQKHRAVSRVTECDSHGLSPQKEKEEEKNQNPSSELKPSSDQARVTSQNETQQPSKEACRLAALLKSEILRNNSNHKITQAQERRWVITADRMLRIDNRTSDQIAEVIQWAQRDNFWMANILSMDTLRGKFDQLSLKMRANGRSADPVKLPDTYVSVSEQRRAEQRSQQVAQ